MTAISGGARTNYCNPNKIISCLCKQQDSIYHGSPYKVTTLKPAKPRSMEDDPFTHTEGVFFSDNKKEAMIYAVARDKERKNKGWAVFDGKLYIKDKLKGKFDFNKKGYLYVVDKDKEKCLTDTKYPHQYIITCPIKPDCCMEVTLDDIISDVVYINEDEKRELEKRMKTRD